MTFKELAVKLRSCMQNVPNISSVLSDAFENIDINVYASDEHVVGKWIDGTSDVYERTFVTDINILDMGSHILDNKLKPSVLKALWLENGFYKDGSGVILSGIGMRIGSAEDTGLYVEAVDAYLEKPALTVRYVKS